MRPCTRRSKQRRAWRSGRRKLAHEAGPCCAASRMSARNQSVCDYARQSFIDTLTLYLHGICCDIDVETGPRQLQSRYLRKRLSLLYELFPRPKATRYFPNTKAKPSQRSHRLPILTRISVTASHRGT